MKNVAITADISRRLKSEQFDPSSTITVDVPRDTVLKALQIRFSGSVETEYASGSPESDATSTMDRLINYIDVTANGSFTIKNVSPWMLHIQNLLASGELGTRRSSAGASATNNPTEDGKFAIGTTDQITSVVESVLVSFENVLAGRGSETTFWDTRGLSSAVMKFSTAAYDNILEFGSDGIDDWVGADFVIQTSTVETTNVPRNASLNTWKQTTQSVQFSAQTNEFRQSVNRGNYLQGFLFEVRDGDAAKSLSDIALSEIKLIMNGSNYLQNTNFFELKEKNRDKFGVNAPYESDVSVFDGMAYMDLLTPTGGQSKGSLGTAQNAQSPLVDEVQLGLTTTSDATYTNGVNVKIMTNEIIRPISEG